MQHVVLNISAILAVANFEINFIENKIQREWRIISDHFLLLFQINDAVASTSEDSTSKDVSNGQITVTLADK